MLLTCNLYFTGTDWACVFLSNFNLHFYELIGNLIYLNKMSYSLLLLYQYVWIYGAIIVKWIISPSQSEEMWCVSIWVERHTDQYAHRIWKRTNRQGHFNEHAPRSEFSSILCLLSLLLACDFRLLFPFISDDPMVCSISNPDFVIYSSVVSFYLPFIVTLLVYIRIYVFLRMRRKRISFGQPGGKVQPGLNPPSVVRPLS